ncbi:hypothetical protein L2E82_31915 [Cichorium intybus]|uniref:Uncharacterized protein n=1 Tax=Cichorium intybus TaxID=13427 RepID=A0ACB9BGJ9_CICIN|nr:hypothetical protein L2E82_31915 [Cichorium intybus]
MDINIISPDYPWNSCKQQHFSTISQVCKNQVFRKMSSQITSTPLRLVRCARCRKVLPEPPDVSVYSCGGCGLLLQAKKLKNDTVDTTPKKLEEDSSGKRKMDGDQEPGSSTNHSINEPDRKTSDHNDVHVSVSHIVHIPSELPISEDQDAAKKAEKRKVDASSDVVKEYSSGKQKMEQLSDDQEACSSSNQQSIVSSIDEPDRNDPRSSTELSGHGDPESSPEATAHNRKDQDQDTTKNRSGSRSPEAGVHDRIHHDQEPIDEVLENCKNEVEFDESSRELTGTSPEKCSFSELNEIEEPSQKAIPDRRIVRDSDRGSKSSFKTLIAEKLLDTRQKKVVYMDEDDIPSEDGSADLCHRRRFERISSEETLENARLGGTSYEYEGSVSSFDGTNNQIPTKKHVDSGNEYYHKQRREFHPSKARRGKDEHRSTEFRSFYGHAIPPRQGLNDFHENQRHRPRMIPGNAKMERLELLKMVRELQDQLERTNVSNSGQQVPSSESDFSAAVRVNPEPDDHRHRIDIPKPYNSPKRRYVRPISGGSPWVTCYQCSEILQLPQSFLVLKKRCHSLRCGSCQKVLNFTVSDGTHVHRYYPEETIAAPPSSEVEDYGNPRADFVSCSDISFQKSYSTETDRNGSREFGDERRKAMMSRGPSGSTGPSSSSKTWGQRKATSEIEEVEPAYNGSPLHWLMGYASPSKVIRG